MEHLFETMLAKRWGLTARESQVMQQMMRGLWSTKDLAAHLGTTASTVGKHVDAISRKSGLNGRGELAVFLLDRLRQFMGGIEKLRLTGPGQASVMVVDDDPDLASLLAANLDAEGFYTTTVTEADQAYEQYLAHGPEVLICDYVLGPIDGMELLRRAASLGAQAPSTILITGYPERLPPADLSILTWVMMKPLNLTELVAQAWSGVTTTRIRRMLAQIISHDNSGGQ